MYLLAVTKFAKPCSSLPLSLFVTSFFLSEEAGSHEPKLSGDFLSPRVPLK